MDAECNRRAAGYGVAVSGWCWGARHNAICDVATKGVGNINRFHTRTADKGTTFAEETSTAKALKAKEFFMAIDQGHAVADELSSDVLMRREPVFHNDPMLRQSRGTDNQVRRPPALDNVV